MSNIDPLSELAGALEESRRPEPRANLSAPVTECKTCGGDRFVVVRLRSPQQTAWQKEHGITPPTDRFYEEMAPCPDCNQIEVTYWQADGRQFRSMDAQTARKAMGE